MLHDSSAVARTHGHRDVPITCYTLWLSNVGFVHQEAVTFQEEINNAEHVESVRRVSQKLVELNKTIYQKEAKEFYKLLRALETALNEQRRGSAKKKADDVVSAASAPPPLWTVLSTLQSQEGDSVGQSLHEAKNGISAAKMIPVSNVVDLMKGTQMMKRAVKDLNAHLKVSVTGTIDMRELPVRRKVDKLLRKNFDAALFSELLLPEHSTNQWSEKVFAPQWFGHTGRYLTVGFAPFCLTEVRCVLSGSYVACGIPYETVPGSTLKEKRKHMFAAQYGELKEMVANGGWMCKVGENEAIVIPSGFLVVQIALETTIGIRWGVSGDDEDCERVKFALNQLMDSFPELRNASAGNSPFLEFLTNI